MVQIQKSLKVKNSKKVFKKFNEKIQILDQEHLSDNPSLLECYGFIYKTLELFIEGLKILKPYFDNTIRTEYGILKIIDSAYTHKLISDKKIWKKMFSYFVVQNDSEKDVSIEEAISCDNKQQIKIQYKKFLDIYYPELKKLPDLISNNINED